MAGETPTPQNLQSLVGWASVPVIGRDSYFHFIYLHLLTNVPAVVTNAPPVVTIRSTIAHCSSRRCT
jgi:hypothetical protein